MSLGVPEVGLGKVKKWLAHDILWIERPGSLIQIGESNAGDWPMVCVPVQVSTEYSEIMSAHSDKIRNVFTRINFVLGSEVKNLSQLDTPGKVWPSANHISV